MFGQNILKVQLLPTVILALATLPVIIFGLLVVTVIVLLPPLVTLVVLVNGYVYSHEKRCDGQIVAILPYQRIGNTLELLFRLEDTPYWSKQNFPDVCPCSFTGGVDPGMNPIDTAVKELAEESGYGLPYCSAWAAVGCHLTIPTRRLRLRNRRSIVHSRSDPSILIRRGPIAPMNTKSSPRSMSRCCNTATSNDHTNWSP